MVLIGETNWFPFPALTTGLNYLSLSPEGDCTSTESLMNSVINKVGSLFSAP